MHKDRDRQVFVETDYPVAIDSPDHITPWGTMRDNTYNESYINEILSFFSGPISVLDIGCSGGGMVRGFYDKGCAAIGIEGSDYSVVNSRAEWADLHNKNLFTCDASRDYQIRFSDTNEPMTFDLISAWEVIEHIHPDRLDIFFQNISKHMSDGGMFIGSISTVSEMSTGIQLHQSIFSVEEWMERILSKHFHVDAYPFQNYARIDHGSFYVKLTKRA